MDRATDLQGTIAVMVPCHDEATTIARVVRDFREALPQATVYVFDNVSTDDTAARAEAAGAVVQHERRKGKGNVVRSMFRDIDADFYLLVDGDCTYPADRALDLLTPLASGQAQMTVGRRLSDHAAGAFPAMHHFGNRAITGTINWLFGAGLTDVLSGYRGFTRDFVKTTPLLSKGFEIETELTIQALSTRRAVVEVPIPYGRRPEGSESKLHTFRDGFNIGRTILDIFKDERPLFFFGPLAIIAMLLGLVLGIPVVGEFAQTGLVPRFPTAILASALVLLGMQLLGVGLVLDALARHRRLSQELWILGRDHHRS